MRIATRTRARAALTVGLLAAARAAPAGAQAPAPPPEPPPRLEAAAQFTFLDTRGNASSQALGAGADVVWRPDPWTYTAKGVFAQTEADDTLKARSVTALGRAARAVGGRLSVYGQYSFLRDVFAGIEQRHVAEAGLAYALVDTKTQRLRLDAGIGYLNERHPADRLEGATLTAGLPYRLALSKTSELTYEPTFLLPLSDTEAWRFGHTAALAVAINTLLALKVSHVLRYAAEPPPTFRTTDTIMAVSLVARMKRAR